MAKTTKAINVSIGASLKELEQAMRDAGIMVEDFSAKAQKAGAQGSSGFEALEKSAKAFRREQVQEGRLVGFYVKELADFTEISDSAKNTIGNLGQTLMAAATGGLSFGLAFEAAKLVVGVIRDTLNEATKEAEKTAAAILKIQQRIDAIGKSKRQVMLEEVSKLTTLLKEFDAASEALKDSGTQGTGSAEDVRYDAALKALYKYAKEHDTTVQALIETERKLWEEYRAEESAAQNKADIEQATRQEEQKKAQVELAIKAAKTISDKEIAEAKRVAEEKKKIADQAAKDKAKLSSLSAISQGLTDAMLGDEGGVTPGKSRGSYFTDAAKNSEKALEAMAKKAQDAAMATAEAWYAVGDAMDTTFSAIGSAIGGTAGQFIAQIGKMISQVLGLVVALATASALQSGPAGWVIALPAASAILASLIGIIAGISARADGGWIDAGKPYLVGERGPELVIPSGSGTVIPNHQLGGRGLTINVSTMDAASFERTLRRNDSSLARVLRDMTRSGRGA